MNIPKNTANTQISASMNGDRMNSTRTVQRIFKTLTLPEGSIYIDTSKRKWYEISCKYAGTVQVMARARTLDLAIATASESMKVLKVKEAWVR